MRLARRSSRSSGSLTPRTCRVRSSTPISTAPPDVLANATRLRSTPSGEDRSRLNSSVFPSGRLSRSRRSTSSEVYSEALTATALQSLMRVVQKGVNVHVAGDCSRRCGCRQGRFRPEDDSQSWLSSLTATVPTWRSCWTFSPARSMVKLARPARSDALGSLSAAAEVPRWDSNFAELRQHVDGIGVARLAGAGQFHLSRKSVEIRTRNGLSLERLAFLNRIGWEAGIRTPMTWSRGRLLRAERCVGADDSRHRGDELRSRVGPLRRGSACQGVFERRISRPVRDRTRAGLARAPGESAPYRARSGSRRHSVPIRAATAGGWPAVPLDRPARGSPPRSSPRGAGPVRDRARQRLRRCEASAARR